MFILKHLSLRIIKSIMNDLNKITSKDWLKHRQQSFQRMLNLRLSSKQLIIINSFKINGTLLRKQVKISDQSNINNSIH